VDDTKPSKSARKREYLALQKLGEQMLDLRRHELDVMPIGEDLREALVAAQGIKSRGALRRQKQFIGKLMRHEDPGPIREALLRLCRP